MCMLSSLNCPIYHTISLVSTQAGTDLDQSTRDHNERSTDNNNLEEPAAEQL